MCENIEKVEEIEIENNDNIKCEYCKYKHCICPYRSVKNAYNESTITYIVGILLFLTILYIIL